jgi:hypothetical protein
VSERTFRRYEEEGEAGLWDRRLGKASCKRVPVDRAEEVERLYRERYQGFTVKHFHEHLVKDQALAGATPGRSCIFSWRGGGKAPRKGAHQPKRERHPLPGMMLHQDGSRHAWLAGQGGSDLIVTMDDATGAIYSAFSGRGGRHGTQSQPACGVCTPPATGLFPMTQPASDFADGTSPRVAVTAGRVGSLRSCAARPLSRGPSSPSCRGAFAPALGPRVNPI